jgi:hypothetical protein
MQRIPFLPLANQASVVQSISLFPGMWDPPFRGKPFDSPQSQVILLQLRSIAI